MSVLDDAVEAMRTRLTTIEQQIGPLVEEADALRLALTKLDEQTAKTAVAAAPAKLAKPSGTRGGATRAAGRPAPRRAPRGANRETILAAIAGEAKTAGQIASETGIGRGTVGSTLTKLVGDKLAVKAEKGYRAA